jgi:LAO/AO transport system kinase
MEERTGDAGVYIRSMASRTSHGGLARAACDACDVMDAFGFSAILMETVGVGQSEYDVVAAADTVLVVLCPGAGDGIQAMKAGILEVADVLVVNKSDLAGADQLVMDLEDAVRMRAIRRGGGRRGAGGPDEEQEWAVPVVPCSAVSGDGLPALLAAIDAHRAWIEAGDLAGTRLTKRIAQVRRVVGERLEEELWGRLGNTARAETMLGKSNTPYDVAEEILGAILASSLSSSDTGREPR